MPRSPLRSAAFTLLLALPPGVARAGDCPDGMANVEDQFCIDRWEATTVDAATGQALSPFYAPNPSQQFPGAPWQYRHWTNKPSRHGYEMPDIPEFEKQGNFEPLAVSRPDVFPQGFMNRAMAARACVNAGKRLCTRDEWYRACVGPDGPRPRPGAYPVAFPYGLTYEPGRCNYRVVPAHPLGVVGRSNVQLDDPRLMLAEYQGQRLLAKTGAFSDCKNGYGVYDMVGNQDEVVADKSGENMVFVGSFYSRGQPKPRGCASAIRAHHASAYMDYSIGYRCCADVP